ncbi:MAG: dihydrolipoamide acetyltransferase family protein [Gammaproteobacteria bacterium]
MSNIYPVTVPKWGIEMQEGTIVEWHAEQGDSISKGNDLVDIETDKIVNTMEAPADGVFVRRLVDTGDTLKVGELLGVIAPEGTDDAAIDEFVSGFKPVDASFGYDDNENEATETPEAAPEPEAPAEPAAGDGGKPRVSPAAARLARELGVDVNRVKGTGRGGRISREDVEAFVADQGGEDAAPADTKAAYESLPMSATRKTIAKRLVEAKQQIPHFYLTTDIAMNAALEKRAALKEGGNAVSVNDVIARAVVLALQEHPDVNVHVVGEEIRRFADVNLAIAVATDKGLMTPVVQRAQTLSLTDLAQRSRELADKARGGELAREDVASGTFTLSNLGMFGLTEFAAVINPPQGAILAVGGCSERVVMKNDQPAVAQYLRATLSCDHRAIDGALGAQFLASLKSQLEQPDNL